MNAALNAVFEALFSPFRAAGPGVAMGAASLVTGALLLITFRLTSNQEGLRRAKARVIGQLLAIRLFSDDPWTTARCLGGALKCNLAYLRHSLLPLVVMAAPMALVLIQLDLRFGRQPLRPGDATVVGVTLEPEAFEHSRSVTIQAPAGLAVETPPLRIPALNEIDWRIRAVQQGEHDLRLEVGGRLLVKRVVVGEGLRCVSPVRTGGGFLESLLHPAEPPLPGDLGVAAVTVTYPERPFQILGWRMHWLLAYFVISMALAFALKRPFGVEV